MTETQTPYDALAVGARVREREMRVDRAPREGVVLDGTALPGYVYVRWDGDPSRCRRWTMRPDALEVIDTPPARAPERELCPGIVVSEDTADGKPRIEGTRLRADAMAFYWRREVAEGHGPGTAARHVANTYEAPIDAVLHAVAFEAGRLYEAERRKARKERRRARTFLAGQAAAEGVGE